MNNWALMIDAVIVQMLTVYSCLQILQKNKCTKFNARKTSVG